ncbi:type I restriction-modification system subunit M N-terminal domain-containing protein [Helicobacter sp. T3_23-1056]
MKTTQTTINNIVWKACDTFRGSMDNSDYKDYILTMLFIKYLSDFHKEKVEQLTQIYNGNTERIEAKLKTQRFFLDKTCTFDYLLSQKESPNLGEIINTALEKIEQDNSEKLEGIFRSIDFNNKNKLGDTKERNALLKNLLEDFSDFSLDLRPSHLEDNDCLGDAYEYLIAHFAESAGKKGGEFYTPSAVSSLLAQLVEPKDGVSVYDPACGSGSLLIKVAKTLTSQHKNANFRL